MTSLPYYYPLPYHYPLPCPGNRSNYPRLSSAYHDLSLLTYLITFYSSILLTLSWLYYRYHFFLMEKNLIMFYLLVILNYLISKHNSYFYILCIYIISIANYNVVATDYWITTWSVFATINSVVYRWEGSIMQKFRQWKRKRGGNIDSGQTTYLFM